MKGCRALSLETQFIAFFISIGIGIGGAFLFDFYRVAKLILKLKRLGTSIGDLLVWVVLTFMVFSLLLWVNWGEVRWYIVLGLGLGAILYHRLFPRGGLVFWRRSFSITGRIVRFLERVIRFLASPLVFAWRLVQLLFRLLASPFVRLRKWVRRHASKSCSEVPDDSDPG